MKGNGRESFAFLKKNTTKLNIVQRNVADIVYQCGLVWRNQSEIFGPDFQKVFGAETEVNITERRQNPNKT